jgi:hypothetical protein
MHGCNINAPEGIVENPMMHLRGARSFFVGAAKKMENLHDCQLSLT